MSGSTVEAVSPTSLSGRIRDFLSPKAKASALPSSATNSTSTPLTAQCPSRIPVRKKRSFGNVSKDDERSHVTSPRARSRQRRDSTSSVSSVATIKPKTISKQSSRDSVRTITESSSKLRRTSSSVSLKLQPGRAAPAKAVLTRTTSHNAVQCSPSTQDIIPLPVKIAAEKRSTKRLSKERATENTTTSSREVTRGRRRGLARTTSDHDFPIVTLADEMSASESRDEQPSSFALAMASAPTPTTSSGSFKRTTKASADEDAMLTKALEYLVNETDDDDVDAAQFRALLEQSVSSPVSATPSPVSPVKSLVPGPSGNTMAFSFSQIAKTMVLPQRFKVSLIPIHRHWAIWDCSAGDTIIWLAVLAIADTKAKGNEFRGRVPIQAVNIEFRSVDGRISEQFINGVSVQFPQESSDDQVYSHFTVNYIGHTARRSKAKKELSESTGICIENTWHCGPFPDSRKKFSVELSEDTTYAALVYVPIPLRLFHYESRFFTMRARVTFGDIMLHPSVGYSAEEQVLIEHLNSNTHLYGANSTHPKSP